MKVGFIGLGIMGKPMAKNLLKAGHEVCVNDFHPESVAELVEAGATSAATNAEVAKDVEVVITMVPNSPNVRAALLEKDGVIDGASSDTVIIDMSSIDPVESKKISAELKEKKGIEMLDCPVSGGEPKAIDGTLSIMCGGNKEIFDKYKAYDKKKTVPKSVILSEMKVRNKIVFFNEFEKKGIIVSNFSKVYLDLKAIENPKIGRKNFTKKSRKNFKFMYTYICFNYICDRITTTSRRRQNIYI